jgi:hypothetical protein
MKKLIYGTQEFLDILKNTLNNDEKFRSLGKEDYTASEIIIIKDLKIGFWQKTIDGEIKELFLIPKNKISEYETMAEISYYIENYETVTKLCTENISFIQMIIDGQIDVKGNLKKLKKIQSANERMEKILKEICKNSLVLNKEQYIKWLAQNNFL